VGGGAPSVREDAVARGPITSSATGTKRAAPDSDVSGGPTCTKVACNILADQATGLSALEDDILECFEELKKCQAKLATVLNEQTEMKVVRSSCHIHVEIHLSRNVRT